MAGTKCPGTRWQTMTRPPASTRWAVFSPATQREALGPSTARATAPASATSPHLHHLHQLSCLLLALSCCCCCWLVGCLCAVCDSFGFANCTTLQLSTIGKAAFSKRKARAGVLPRTHVCAQTKKQQRLSLAPLFLFCSFPSFASAHYCIKRWRGERAFERESKGVKAKAARGKERSKGKQVQGTEELQQAPRLSPSPFPSRAVVTSDSESQVLAVVEFSQASCLPFDRALLLCQPGCCCAV